MEGFELYILGKQMQSLCLVDSFISMIWTDRYMVCGDFELVVPVTSNALVYASHGNYVWAKGSDRMMIIEQTEITTDVENGSTLKITGRSLESLLDRRIVWKQITLSGKIQTVIKRLITDAFITPDLSARAVSNFIFVDSDDAYIDSCEMEEAQYLGDSLYDVVCDICSVFNVGFKIIYDFDNGNFEFELYYGADRSYNQDTNPWVVFSPEFDNIISSDFVENSAQYKNVNLVAGEDSDDHNKLFVYVNDGSDVTGLERREMFTDGSSKQRSYDETTLTDEQYTEVLRSYGLEELYLPEHRLGQTFDGEMNTTRGFSYGVDFMIGDVVQMENEYGQGDAARVTEFIMSQDSSGVKMYPSFDSTVV